MSDSTMVRPDAEKDSATLEREIDRTRAQMGQTLGALERKFSPGEFLDQTMDLVRQHGGQLAGNISNVITQNPGPALLTAAGIVWMVFSSNRSKTSLRARTVDYEYEPSAEGYRVNDFRNSESRLGESRSDEFSSGDYRTKEEGSGVLAQASQQISSAAQATRQKLTSSKDAVASGFNKTTETAQEQVARVREGFNNIMEEQPLIIGALGIALGACIGAALPTTQQEDRLLGSVSDQTIAKVKETGAESFNQVKESVTQIGDEAKRTLADAKQALSETVGKASAKRS